MDGTSADQSNIPNPPPYGALAKATWTNSWTAVIQSTATNRLTEK